MNKKALTLKQKRFVEEYLIELNATKAAIRAGYSRKTARFIGAENLTKPNIAAALHKAMDARSKCCAIEADSVLRKLAHLAGANIGDYLSWGPNGVQVRESADLTDAQSYAISEIMVTPGRDGLPPAVRIKLHDKVAALEKLGKHLNLFTDVLQLTPAEEAQNLTDEELEAKAVALFGKAAEALVRTRR